MRILIEERVHQAIESFYDAAILRHWHTLSFDTVENKKNRLYDGLESLANYATIFPKATCLWIMLCVSWPQSGLGCLFG